MAALETLRLGHHKPEVTVVDVGELPPVDVGYAHVVIRFPDHEPIVVSGPNAQRIGMMVAQAGGWFPPPRCP